MADGFAPVLWHLSSKKTNTEDWCKAVRDGRLTQALRSLNPRRKTGPWTVLCDGEAFLRAKDSLAAYRSKKIVLWGGTCQKPRLEPRGDVLGVAAPEASHP